MEYALGKLLGAMFIPSRFGVLILILGIALYGFKKLRRTAVKIVIFAAVFLYLCSIPLFSGLLARRLEGHMKPYAKVDSAPPPEWIAVVSSGVRGAPGFPPTQKLYASTMARLVEGRRIAMMFPNAKIVLSGGDLADEHSSVRAMSDAALELGIPPDRMQPVEGARTTHEEIALLAPILGDERTIIVSSALHLPRVCDFARAYGLNFSVAPCQFRTKGPFASGWGRFLAFVPSSDALSLTDDAVHELGGRIWLRLFTRKPIEAPTS